MKCAKCRKEIMRINGYVRYMKNYYHISCGVLCTICRLPVGQSSISVYDDGKWKFYHTHCLQKKVEERADAFK